MLNIVKAIEKIDSFLFAGIMLYMKPQCIVCDAVIVVPIDVQESEVLTCTDCKSRLVVQ